MAEQPRPADQDATRTRVTSGDRGSADSTGELVGRASQQLGDLVRSEMELARAEMQTAIKHAGIGAGLFGAAGILALYGGGVLIAAVVLALGLVLAWWLAALIVAVVLFVAAGIAALVGKKQVEQTTPPLQDSVASVKRDVETVTQGGKA